MLSWQRMAGQVASPQMLRQAASRPGGRASTALPWAGRAVGTRCGGLEVANDMLACRYRGRRPDRRHLHLATRQARPPPTLSRRHAQAGGRLELCPLDQPAVR
jgi:hypothetical protein